MHVLFKELAYNISWMNIFKSIFTSWRITIHPKIHIWRSKKNERKANMLRRSGKHPVQLKNMLHKITHVHKQTHSHTFMWKWSTQMLMDHIVRVPMENLEKPKNVDGNDERRFNRYIFVDASCQARVTHFACIFYTTHYSPLYLFMPNPFYFGSVFFVRSQNATCTCMMKPYMSSVNRSEQSLIFGVWIKTFYGAI